MYRRFRELEDEGLVILKSEVIERWSFLCAHLYFYKAIKRLNFKRLLKYINYGYTFRGFEIVDDSRNFDGIVERFTLNYLANDQHVDAVDVLHVEDGLMSSFP